MIAIGTQVETKVFTGYIPFTGMEIMVLGTGHPVPQVERMGTSFHVTIGGDQLLVDCGPGIVTRLIESEIDFSEIGDLFFTHHHIDHNAGFFHFVPSSWILGRNSLSVYGPSGTEDLVRGLEMAYRRSIDSWIGTLAETGTGINEIEVTELSPGESIETTEWAVQTFPLSHTIETYGYRFEERRTGRVFAVVSDTRCTPDLPGFVEDADLLVFSCNGIAPSEALLPLDEIDARYLNPPFKEFYETKNRVSDKTGIGNAHINAVEAAKVGSASNASMLVLTHFDPFRDTDTILSTANQYFDGEVIVATDGTSLEV